jgi:hypothetical protein
VRCCLTWRSTRTPNGVRARFALLLVAGHLYVRAPMNHTSKLVVVAICAVLLPGVFIAATNHTSGTAPREDLVLLLANWLLTVLPQLAVIALAAVFPRLRRPFALRALVLLSVLLPAFVFLTSLDANGPMLWAFYFPLSAALMLLVGLISTRKADARGF